MASKLTSIERELDKLTVQVEGLELEDNKAGSGAYGVVFKVTVNGRECIAKKLHNILLKAGYYYPLDQRDSIIEKFRNECFILSGLNHPNVVSFVGVHYGKDKNDLSLIMERLHTDLAAFVHSHPQTTKSQRIYILSNVSKGLEYLHSLTPPLIHRDLTAPNILLTEDLTAKIGDLGVSRYVDPNSITQVLSKAPGNVYYMPPETRHENPKYTVKLDIFSFGTLIIHTFIGKVPGLHDVPYDTRAVKLSHEGKIELTRRRKAINQLGTEHCMYPMIVRCLHDNPDPRPTAEVLCQELFLLCQKHPAVGFQKSEIRKVLGEQLKKEDTWFMVGVHWMKQWKQYVGYNSWDPTSSGQESANPGPLDNASLLEGEHLHHHLMEELDYCLLPKSAWDKLLIWYDLSSESKVISRRVVESVHTKQLKVEVYLLELKLCTYPYLYDIKKREFSRTDTVDNLINALRKEFKVPSSTECRAWHQTMTHTYELLTQSDQALQEAGLYTGQVIVLEKKDDDGMWPQTPLLVDMKKEVESDLTQKLQEGDIWYLVDTYWMRQWEKYVSGEFSHPGPLDNSKLFKGNNLQGNMTEELNYSVLPESVWCKLLFQFGLKKGSKAIPRRVIGYGLYTKHLKVEVYLLGLKLCVHPHLSHLRKREFSRADTVEDLEKALREEFEFSSSTKCRVCILQSYNKYKPLADTSQTLLDAGLYSDQTIVLVGNNEENTLPSIADLQNLCIPGVCGLKKLGSAISNVSNSFVQCLSNTVPMTEHFLKAGYKPYKNLMNKDDSLGVSGSIAKAYSSLLEDIWSGEFDVVSPNKFQSVLDQAGYQYTDLKDLLGFILNALHDDLNLRKPSASAVVEPTLMAKADQKIAEETWYKHCQNNQSIIVETFHGQLRSTYVCLKCSQPTKTFDPFMFLSLPLSLPIKKTESRTISVYLVGCNPMDPVRKVFLLIDALDTGIANPMEAILLRLTTLSTEAAQSLSLCNKISLYSPGHKCMLMLAKKGTVGDLKMELEMLSGVKATHIAVVDVYKSRFHRIYSARDPLSHIMNTDDIYCYELNETTSSEKKMVHVPVYCRVKVQSHSVYQYSSPKYGLFGVPTVVLVSAECTYRTLYLAIISKLRKYIKLWPKVKELKDGSTEEMDLFRLVVVNEYGSQEIKKLVDDPRRPLSLTGSTYIGCDWDAEVKEKCYDEKAVKEYEDFESPADNQTQLINCFELFTFKNTKSLHGGNDMWHCTHCKKLQDGQVWKKVELWKVPDTLIVHLNRFPNKSDYLDGLVDFPVTGLNLSSFVLCSDSPEAIYDLFAVANHSNDSKGGHYTTYAKNKETKKWYCFDNSSVSEITEDQIVTKAAYVLFYRRNNSNQPFRSID